MKRVADWEEIFSLCTPDGWVLSSDGEGRELVPIWPHPAYAAACATGEWGEAEPAEIALEAWLERWTPGMERENRQVAVFPTPDHAGVIAQPSRLKLDLEAELSRYE